METIAAPESTQLHPLILIAIFAVSSSVGYFLIKKVPSKLHTPLMSGMNALSGITILGALLTTAFAVNTGSKLLGFVAIITSMLSCAGGFGITHRMLRMFRPKKKKQGEVRPK